MRAAVCSLCLAVLVTACGSSKPKTSCKQDSDCAGGQVCVSGTCTNTCNSARPCPVGETCLDGFCGNGTADAGGCAGGCDGGTCIKDACYSSDCFGTLCPAGEVCVGGGCVEQDCVGVICPAGTTCAHGACVSSSCGGSQCPTGDVCVAGQCVQSACVDVMCPAGSLCGNGVCVSQTCGSTTCGATEVCDNGSCVDARCAGVGCTMGGVCVAGVCEFPGCGSATCDSGDVCTMSGQCRSAACAAVVCPQGQLCNDGQCFPTDCPAQSCGPEQVCDNGACVWLDCAGVHCPMGSACAAGGVCLSRSCQANVDCPGVYVCLIGTCVDPRCVGVTCPSSTVCSGGTCWPDGPPGGMPCGMGKAFIRGACRELVCEGVSCNVGEACEGGSCVAGGGVYPAGVIYPNGSSSAAVGVVARFNGTSWERMNATPLPPLQQLEISQDGTSLFAVTTNGGLWVTHDGATWVQRWQGDTGTTGYFRSVTVSPVDGALYGSVMGQSGNDLGQVISSVDQGDSWTFFTRPPIGGFSSRSEVTGFAQSPADPSVMWMSYDEGYFWSTRGVSATASGAGGFTQVLDKAGMVGVIAHPTDPTFAYWLGPQVYFTDGGVSGAFNTCGWCVKFKPGDGSLAFASSSNQVFKTANDGLSWGPRTQGVPVGAALTQLAFGPDQALYAGNATGAPPLIRSVDDGETWSEVAASMATTQGLSDPYPAWAPDASYAQGALASPSVLDGWIYRASVAGVSGGSEPGWVLDGGTVVDGTVHWVQDRANQAMRVTGLAARTCAVGDVLCNGSCVNLFSDRAHCGSCARACGPGVGCYAGTCLGPETVDAGASDAGVDGGASDAGGYTGPTAGCADGTREGFYDVSRYPHVAGCAGVWPGELTDAGADALCGAGWHVCNSTDPVLRSISFLEAVAFPGCFAYRASNDYADGCDVLDCRPPTGSMTMPPAAADHDDIAGVGSGCALLSGVTVAPSSVPASSAGACLMDKGVIDAQCCNISDPVKMAPRPAGCLQRGETGVLCCQ